MSVANTAEQQEVTLEEALDLARGHHFAGNYVLADRTYRDILRAVEDHFPTTLFLGVLQYQLGNFEESLLWLNRAGETNPDDKQVWNNIGAVLTDSKKPEEAIEAFDKALAIDHEFVEALNNKALALWMLDRHEEAETMARAALKVTPDNMESMDKLGIALAGQKKFEEAVEAWEKAVEANPDVPKLWANLGNALRELGRIKESEEKCRKALELNPDFPEALNNLGNALRDRGEFEEAGEMYRKATNLMPEYYMAHNNLAICLMDQNLYEDAAIAARYAVAFERNDARSYNTLSSALSHMGDYNNARAAAQRAIYLAPEDVQGYLDLADVNMSADLLDDGEAALHEALRREPDSPRTLKKLAEIRQRLNDNDGALKAIDEALELSPQMPVLWQTKSHILQMSDDPEGALKAIDKAIKLTPKSAFGLPNKAEILIALNRNEEAEKLVRKTLEINDDMPGPYYTLTNLKKFKSEDDPDFVAMKAFEDCDEKWGLSGKTVIHYALSDAYEHMGKYDEAFHHLKTANDTKRKMIPYDAKKQPKEFFAIKQRFNPEYLQLMEGRGCDSDLPVFILGMPRSGTTLTEQIISSHPDVFGAGELPFIGKLRDKFGHLTVENAREMGEEYIRLIKARDKSGKVKRITDKMPGNYVNVGMILSILPNAKVIHCRRNPMDTALSCYKQNFAQGQYWSYDLKELAQEYNRYLDIMAFWRQLLGDRFLEIDYEETVSNTEAQARKLIDFVGLDWNDACLEPHKQKRMVLTASKAQVTKPVYKTSVEKWKRYEDGLQPLIDHIDFDLLPEGAFRPQV